MRLLFAVPALAIAAPVAAQTDPAETEIRAVIADYYAELAKKDKARIDSLTAPNFIEAAPHYRFPRSRSAAAQPLIYDSLAARALEFRYDVDALRIDPNFARAQVWERGYFYASAAQKTYEMAARTTFLFERVVKDGRWRIVAHHTNSEGIPPNKITKPMPDLRELYYATQGKDRDPAADAREAAATRF